MASRVPNEVWRAIFVYLPLNKLVNLLRVCRKWHNIGTSDEFREHLLRQEVRTRGWYQDPLDLFDLDRKEGDWQPPAPGTKSDFLRACLHRPALNVQNALAIGWLQMRPSRLAPDQAKYRYTALAQLLITHYALAPTPQYRASILTLVCRIGLASPNDFFHENSSLLCLMLAHARSSPNASSLFQHAAKAAELRKLFKSFPSMLRQDLKPDTFVTLLLSKTPTKQIAEQLTYRSAQLLQCVLPSHIIYQVAGFNKEAARVVVNHFNGLAGACSYVVLSERDEKLRMRRIEKVLELYLELMALRNFDCAMAVVSGIDTSYIMVQRIKKPKMYTEMISSMRELCSSQHNWQALRDAIRQAEVDVHPFVPPFALLMSDATFIVEGNPTLIGGVNNYKPMELLVSAFKTYFLAQKRQYGIARDAAIQEVLEVAFACYIDDNEKSKLSAALGLKKDK